MLSLVESTAASRVIQVTCPNRGYGGCFCAECSKDITWSTDPWWVPVVAISVLVMLGAGVLHLLGILVPVLAFLLGWVMICVAVIILASIAWGFLRLMLAFMEGF